MRFGLQLPLLSAPRREAILEYAHAAERLGFDSLWTNSHTVIPASLEPRYPYSDDGRPPWNATTPWPDALTSLAFVAAATERVRIGVAVVPLITTEPLTLAKQAATIDVLSNGRFELGIGAGWLTEEAQALGRPTDHRTARLEEAVAILRAAWSAPTFSHDGRFWQFHEVGVNPKPVQGPRLPLWIGGQGDEAVRIAAEHDAGLFVWLPRDGAQLATYRRRLDDRGAGSALAASLPLARVQGRWREATRELQDAGADLLVVIRRYDDTAMADLERYAEEVMGRAG